MKIKTIFFLTGSQRNQIVNVIWNENLNLQVVRRKSLPLKGKQIKMLSKKAENQLNAKYW